MIRILAGKKIKGVEKMIIRRITLLFLAAFVMLSCLPVTVHAIDDPYYLGDIESGTIPLSDDSLSTVLTEYADIVQKLPKERIKNANTTFSTGVISDFNGDTYPELLLLYTVEGMEYDAFEALIVSRTQEGQLSYYRCRPGNNSGNPFLTLYLSREDEKPCFHLVYINQNFRDPVTRFGTDMVVSPKDGVCADCRVLKWATILETGAATYEVDGKEDEAAFQRIFGLIEEKVCDIWENNMPLNDLEYQILHYKP